MSKNNFIKYMTIAFVISAIVVVFNWFSPKGHIYGFWIGIKILFLMGISTGIGMFLGNAIRLALMPDYITTREGVIGLAKAKIFWAVGPQAIGWFIGLMPIYDLIRT